MYPFVLSLLCDGSHLVDSEFERGYEAETVLAKKSMPVFFSIPERCSVGGCILI